MLRRVIMCFLAVVASSSAVCSPIKGAGAISCGRWVEDRKHNTFSEELNWVLGFISAYNHYVYQGSAHSGIFGNADSDAVAVWMDSYCQRNPLSTPYKGATELVDELVQRANK